MMLQKLIELGREYLDRGHILGFVFILDMIHLTNILKTDYDVYALSST